MQPIPPYDPTHVYTFTITVPEGPITFAVGDDGVYDNTGAYTVTIITAQPLGTSYVIPRTENPPTIDGLVDEWDSVPSLFLDKDNADTIQGEVPTPSDLSATLKAVWDSTHLYFAAVIQDDVLIGNDSAFAWRDDGLELGIYIPSDRSHQFTISLDGRQADQGNTISSLTVATSTVSGGWALEVAIPIEALGSDPLLADQRYPFTFALKDDDVGHDSPTQTTMVWEGDSTYSFQQEWGELRLSGQVYDFPTPTPTSTPTPTNTPTPTPTPTSTPTPTATPYPTPSGPSYLIPRAGQPPILDGELNEWDGVPTLSLDKDNASTIIGQVPSPADLSATLRAAWDPDHLYFAATINDDVLIGNDSIFVWQDDALELGIHIPADRSHQFTLALDGRQADQGSAISSLTVVTSAVTGGWSLEVAIPIDALGSGPLATDQWYPFTFALKDDDVGNDSSTQTTLIWQGDSTYSVQPNWGILRLTGQVYDFPTPTPTATPTPTPTATPIPGSISGTVWFDRNGDGVRDPGEPGLVDVTIRLFAGNTQIASTTTLGDGSYQFPSLPPGTYRVQEQNPPWLRFSSTPDEVLVVLSARQDVTVNFGDWNGRPVWMPMILR
ncbi:MAG TPA: hypothetical protein G4O02_17060 [Caldilineae bacterium]|nr:hypothetical protein [Caldilineae bacterium]